MDYPLVSVNRHDNKKISKHICMVYLKTMPSNAVPSNSCMRRLFTLPSFEFLLLFLRFHFRCIRNETKECVAIEEEEKEEDETDRRL